MNVDLSKLGRRLQGKIAGKKHFGEICQMLSDARPGELVVLDFKRIESANASWMNMAIAPLVRWAAEERNDFFPVLANFPPKDMDELELVAQVNGQCYVVATKPDEPMLSVHLVGPLDSALRSTLKKLAELGEATGAELARQMPKEQVQPTAFNNRLKDLHEKRLLFRRKEGRQQFYFPVAKEVVFDG